MILVIIENSTLRKIFEYKIVMSSLNDEIGISNFVDECWRCAVEDGLVKDSERSKYSITVV